MRCPWIRYAFNVDKQLTSITRPDNKTVAFSYDTAGRLNTIDITRGQTTYAYNGTTGKLATITAPDGGALGYTYDGSLLTDVTWTGAIAGSVSRTYDNNFQLTSTKVNGANTVTLQYDNDSLLIVAGSLTLTRNSQNGLLTGTSLGNVSDTFSYSGFGEVTNYNATASGTPVYTVQYTRDKLGRITGKTETINGVTTAFAYTYDTAGRLIQVTQNGVPTATYTYDNNGNRLSGPGLGTVPTYDAQDRLLTYGSTAYTYTANGELLTKTSGVFTTSYEYDELGNLMHVTLPNGTQIDYVIDGQHRRIGRKLNGTLVQALLYEGQLGPIAELDNNGSIVSRFVYGTHVNVPDYMVKNGQTYRLLTDQRGSPRLVINVADGTVTQRMDFDEFGNVLLDTNPAFQPFGFAGGVYDQDTKLVRLGARDYDAITGRWTLKDPVFFAGSQANLYSYSFEDPINFYDPYGLDPCSEYEKLKALDELLKKRDERLQELAKNTKDIDPYTFLPPGLKKPSPWDIILPYLPPIFKIIRKLLTVEKTLDPFIDAAKDAEKADKEYEEKLQQIEKERQLREFKQLLKEKFKIEYVDNTASPSRASCGCP